MSTVIQTPLLQYFQYYPATAQYKSSTSSSAQTALLLETNWRHASTTGNTSL
jgi:hypothetical protein